MGLTKTLIADDGHCMFRSVGTALGDCVATNSVVMQLRHVVVEHVISRWSQYSQFYARTDSCSTPARYRQRMGRMENREWGGEPEQQAIANVTGLVVFLYHPHTSRLSVKQPDSCAAVPANQPSYGRFGCLVYFDDENHYHIMGRVRANHTVQYQFPIDELDDMLATAIEPVSTRFEAQHVEQTQTESVQSL